MQDFLVSISAVFSALLIVMFLIAILALVLLNVRSLVRWIRAR